MRLLILTSSGAYLAVDSTNLDIYTSIIRNHGAWEPHVLNACQLVMIPGGTFYDIGANAGYMSIEMAHLFRAQHVKVIAFEPQPSLAYVASLSAKVNRFEHFQVYECMLGKEQGVGQLFIPSHAIHASTITREPNAKVISCRMTTLDQHITDGNLPLPDVMKVDIEGGELDFFHGARHTVQVARPCIVFESDVNMTRFGYSRQDVLNYLASLVDYQFYYVDRQGISSIQTRSEERKDSNILAIPHEKIEGMLNKL